MFLVEVVSGNLLFGFIPESGALLLCGVSLIGGAIVARKFLKHQDSGKNSQDNNGEDRETK